MRTEPIGMAVAVLFLLASGQACAGFRWRTGGDPGPGHPHRAKVRLATAQRQLEGQRRNRPGRQRPGADVRHAGAGGADDHAAGSAGGADHLRRRRQMTATFLFPGGYEVDAASGAELPGNYRVESISLDQVVLTDKDGNRVPVGFSALPRPKPPPRPRRLRSAGAARAVPQPFIQ